MSMNIKRVRLSLIPLIILITISFTFSQDIDRSSKYYAYSLMEKGIFHFNLNQYEAAIDYFTQSLKIYPSLIEAREWRAKAFFRTGQIENSREEYKRLISINPDNLRLIQTLNQIDFLLSHPETFDYKPNYITSAVYPLQQRFKNSIPINISLISNNIVAIPDFETGKVGFYSIDGKYQYSIPQGNDRLSKPFDVTSDNEGNIYITDYDDNNIYKYSKELNLLKVFGSDNSNTNLYGPRGIISDGSHNLYVIDRWNREIKKFSHEGDYILSVSNRVDGLYEIEEPFDIAFHNEVIYFTDSIRGSIFAFDNYGTFINEYRNELIKKPRGISLSKDKDKLIITDEYNGILFLYIDSGKIEKVGNFADINGRFLSVVETFDGRLLGVNESITAIYAFIDEIIKSSGLLVDVVRSTINYNNDNTSISHILSVNDKLGRPIIDLSLDDINIKEQNIDLGNPSYFEKFPTIEENGIAITIINELSYSMNEKQDDIKKFLENIINNLGPKDSIQIININQNIVQKNDFNSQPIEVLYLFNEDEYTDIKNVKIGKGLIFAIGKALSVYNKSSAVIFLSSGNTPDKSFGNVTAGEIFNYSLANRIPIYTVVFGKDNENDFLSRLASESDGILINYYKSPRINKVLDIVKENEQFYYIISYDSIVGNANEYRYKEAFIDITTNGMTGSTKVGYFDKYSY